MLALPKNLDGVLYNKTHRFTHLWKITRTDAEKLYFTSHNEPIEFDGQTYIPAGGAKASARQKQSGLRDQNLEFEGVITSDSITHDDLRAGRYREAEVMEHIVDWMYPWAGAILTARYWISEVKFTGAIWEAAIEGITRWIRGKVGDVYGRGCRWDLGDGDCKVTVAPYNFSGHVTSITEATLNNRNRFHTNLTQADGYFDYGLLEWDTGNNANIYSEVKIFTNADGKIGLEDNTPFSIVVNDTFNVTAGCDKKAGTCKTKFSNILNFGGFPFIPGTDKMFNTPNAK